MCDTETMTFVSAVLHNANLTTRFTSFKNNCHFFFLEGGGPHASANLQKAC